MSKQKKSYDSRQVFIDTLMELAEKDEKIVLIVPDVGFNYIEKFREKFPDRFFNFGVTEQSTMIIAAGLALSGMKPYVYSMINFVVFRPYEMVRNAICHHNANVKLIGVKGSEKYKFLGFSHNMNRKDEDVYALQDLPNMRCYHPITKNGIINSIKDTYEMERPIYIRL